jgi:hypothetical protein
MPSIDINDAIRSAVAQEVNRVLGPHMDTLERLSRALGTSAPRRAQSVSAPAGRMRVARRGAATGPAGLVGATQFQEGQRVIYRQGRGAFEATVTGIHAATNKLTLKREMDGKKVERPAAKVHAA